MKRRLYFLPIFIIVVTLFIVGSIFDLTISQNMVHLRNGFSIFFAAITGLPTGFALGFISGNLFSYYKKYRIDFKKWWQHALNIGFIIIFALSSIYIFSSQIVSYHAFNLSKLFMPLFGLIVLIPSFILGLKLFNKFDKPFYIKHLIFISIVCAIPVALILCFKIIAPRIRYTTLYELNGLINDGYSYFRPWYAPGVDKTFITDIFKNAGITLESEAFSSFPSGHTVIAWTALPLYASILVFNRKLIKYDYLIFFGYIIFIFLVAFSRILIGAHFLTDTMFSSLISIMVFYIAYEIYIRKFRFGLDEGDK